MVRASAVFALQPRAQAAGSPAAQAVARLLDDPIRAVRVTAGLAVRDRVDLSSKAGRELVHFLNLAADQPIGQLQLGNFAAARGNLSAALDHLRKAVDWDPLSSPLRQEYAVVLSLANQPAEALRQMQEASRLAPSDAECLYRLALAYNEVGQLDRTLESLEGVVRLDPRHARAWYNLGLARNTVGQTDPALAALIQAEAVAPGDPEIPYARATILLQQGRREEARDALQRSLSARPGFAPATGLLEQLRR
jgi:tetratricopeptide (TPR) repeat protein